MKELLGYKLKATIRRLRNAVSGAQLDEVKACLDTIESQQDDLNDLNQADWIDDVERLRSYLMRNWSSIKPFGDKSPQDKLHCLGSCETNHRRYTYCMKRQDRSWG